MGKTQKEHVQYLLKLIEENPDLEVKFLFDNSFISDEYSWSLHEISTISIEDYYIDGDRYYIDEDEIRDCFYDRFDCDIDLSEEEIEEEVDRLYASEVKKMICVYTYA